MELLKSGFVKDFKLNLKAAKEEQRNIFKYLKKYYSNDAYCFIIKKDELLKFKNNHNMED